MTWSLRFPLFAFAASFGLSASVLADKVQFEMADPVASVPAGTIVPLKLGGAVYWENERKIKWAVLDADFATKPSFLIGQLKLERGTPLFLGTFNGAQKYCGKHLHDSSRVRREGYFCFPADAQGAFRSAITGALAGRSQNFEIGDSRDIEAEKPAPFRIEDGYTSGAGFKLSVSFIGEKDDTLTFACKPELIGAAPPQLKSLVETYPGMMSEMRFYAPAPKDGQTTTAAIPVCIGVEAAIKGNLAQIPARIENRRQNRPLKLELSRGPGGLSAKIVKPFAHWSVWLETRENRAHPIWIRQANN